VLANLAEAGLIDLAEIREGDALEALACDLPTKLDPVLLDGAKGLYVDVRSEWRPACGQARLSSPMIRITVRHF
jgi:predicted O-methyltransferase YrrM